MANARTGLLAVGILGFMGCIGTEETDAGETEGATEAGRCSISFMGHEVCDGVDNDCDGVFDDNCSPIDLAAVPALACARVYSAEATTAGDIIVDSGDHLDLIKPNGVTVPGASLPDLMVLALERSASGRIYMWSMKYGAAGVPTGDAYVHMVASDATLGSALVHVTYSPATAVPYMFAVDGAGNFFTGVQSENGVKRWNGTAFVPFSSATSKYPFLRAAAPDGQSVYRVGTYLGPGPGEVSRALVRLTATTATTIDQQFVMPDGRKLSPYGVELDQHGRIYLSTVCYGEDDCSAVFRYDADGTHRALIAIDPGQDSRSFAVDPAANMLLMFRSVQGVCGDNEAHIIRLPL